MSLLPLPPCAPAPRRRHRLAILGLAVAAAAAVLAGCTTVPGSWSARPVSLATPSGGGGRPPTGGLDSVSCPTPTSCVAAGWTAQVARSASGWRDITGSADPYQVDCASETFCLATRFVEGPSSLWRWDGATWTATPPAGDVFTQYDVSCATASSCLLAANASYGEVPVLRRWTGSAWVDAPLPEDVWAYHVDCPSASWCLVAGRGADGPVALRWTPAGVAAMAGALPGELTRISCATAALCLGGGADAAGRPFVVAWDGTAWSRLASPLDGAAPPTLHDLSCGAVGACVVLTGRPDGTAAVAQHWDGVTWAPEALPTGTANEAFRAVSCAGSGFCAAVGSRTTDAGGFDVVPLVADRSPAATPSATVARAA